ncbi:acyltransferase family protein [Vibrio cholerae]|nr:acyltransferase family protein [Vibrio cholerae]
MVIDYKYSWINNTKAIATFLVIIIHVSSIYLIGNHSEFGLNVAKMFNSFSRISVPLFVVLSGYLNIKDECSCSFSGFYKKKANRIIYALLFWTFFFVSLNAAKHLYIYGNINYKDLFNSILYGRPYYHLWFLYMLLGLYLVTPFISIIVQNLDRKKIYYIICALFSIVILDDLYRRYFSIDKGFFLTWFFSYLPYYILGYYLRDISFKANPLLCFLGYIISSLTMFFFIFYFDNDNIRSIVWSYFSIFTVLGTMSFILFMMNISRKSSMLVNNASKYMFGIYLIHPFFIDAFKFANVFDLKFNPIANIFLISLLVMALSLASVYFILWFKFLRKIV